MTIRPELLELTCEFDPSGPLHNQVQARVAKAIYSGNEMQYLLTLSNNLSWKARVPSAGSAAKRFHPGESLYIKWHPSEAVVLPE
jgi:hypothetical protein